MSRRYRVFSDGETVTAVGSPADVRRVIKKLESDGYYNLHTGNPVLREGRTYSVTFPERPSVGNRTYVIGREL